MLLSPTGFLCLLYGAQGLDCRDKNSMQQEQVKCFAAYNITLEINGEDLLNALQNVPEAVCSQQDEYRSALTCAFDVGKRCLRESGVTTDILPDAVRVADGIAYMCRHISEIDPECLENTKPAMEQCVMDKALSKAVSQSMGVSLDVKSLACTGFQLAYDCMKEELHCPGRTKEVYLRLANDYILPPACSSVDDGNDDYSHNDDNDLVVSYTVVGLQFLAWPLPYAVVALRSKIVRSSALNETCGLPGQ
ncbi:hypothetical protein BaRGS_00019625 [Batillaria attramentaria]|uniref:Secreted protein n=1 Tax=Batillaria attramentaria TaxID=370345 RepID=A0ABD0KQ68_9CAEN